MTLSVIVSYLLVLVGNQQQLVIGRLFLIKVFFALFSGITDLKFIIIKKKLLVVS